MRQLGPNHPRDVRFFLNLALVSVGRGRNATSHLGEYCGPRARSEVWGKRLIVLVAPITSNAGVDFVSGAALRMSYFYPNRFDGSDEPGEMSTS